MLVKASGSETAQFAERGGRQAGDRKPDRAARGRATTVLPASDWLSVMTAELALPREASRTPLETVVVPLNDPGISPEKPCRWHPGKLLTIRPS